jgi:hypothetical protein
MARTRKLYLGDGVYLEGTPGHLPLVLTTEDGIRITNRIVLEAEVLGNLIDYLRAVIDEELEAKH